MTESVYCSYHPGKEARWFCKDCRRALCDECIEERRLSRRFVARLHRHQDCRGKCILLDSLLRDALLHPEKTPDQPPIESQPSFFMKTYEWRFILGLLSVALLLFYMLVLHPILMDSTVNIMLSLTGILSGWGLCKRRSWAAVSLLSLVVLYLSGYVLLSFPTETSLQMMPKQSSCLLPSIMLLVFTFALPEFNRR